VKLLMGFEGVNGSTGAPGWTDESPAAHGTATITGSTTISTAQEKFGSSSGAFNVTGGATFPNSADWQFGSSPFTVEGWAYIGSGNPGTLIGLWGTGNQLSWVVLYNNATGKLNWDTSTNGSATNVDIAGATTITLNTWIAWAVDFDGTKYRLYLNGVMDGSFTTVRSLFASTAVLSLGTSFGANRLGGNLDEVRITKGFARYANDSGYTIPAAAFPRIVCSSDPSFSNVVLLMGFEGANNSTGAPGLNDESSHAHGTAGSVGGTSTGGFISTAQFRFGSSSLRSITSGIIFSDSADWILAPTDTSPYTLEGWFWLNSGPTAGQAWLAQRFPVSTADQVFELRSGATASELRWSTWYDGSNMGVDITTSGAGLTTGQWYFVAVDYDGTKCRLYINGVMKGSATATHGATFDSSRLLAIGQDSEGGGATFNGWIDELRITRGIARYASDSGFTVPTAAFPRS
jgi:hypothetical protein